MRESISVFFPAYNDEHTIGGLVRKTLAFLPEHFEDYEVIAVNDGSRDGTGAILEQLRSEFPERFRVVTHETNLGYGGALQSGFAAARKDLVFYTDGDGQYDPLELRSLIRLMAPVRRLRERIQAGSQRPLAPDGHRVSLQQVRAIYFRNSTA